jgi:hypothetical protein
MILLGALAWGLFVTKAGEASVLWTWQSAVIAAVWLVCSAVAWHFLQHLPQGELDFDGEHWYFFDSATQTEQMGTISVRLDVQNAIFLRFESEFKNVSWLWLASTCALKSSASDWHELRCAVYSRPTPQNSLDFI